MTEQPTGPPRWMDRIVELYCRPELLEDLQGDLHEYYERNLRKSRSRANLIFFIDVLKFFRLYTVRKPKILGQMNFFNLFKNYFKTSVRSIARNKLFSSINVVGLAISMSVGIIMITYISELLTYDDFHTKSDRIYRVLSSYKGLNDSEAQMYASTSVFIGKKLQEDYSGIEKAVIMRRNFRRDIAKGDNVISVRGLYTTEEFFDVFSFKLLSGDAATALKEPYSVVLTEKTAKKLFKDANPVGQIVTAGEESFTVTGLVEDIPINSHIQFEALASFSTRENIARQDENTNFFTYRSIWSNYVYLLLPEDHNTEPILTNLHEVASVENAKTDRYTIDFDLENLADVMPGKDLNNKIGPGITWQLINMLVTLTAIVIISACFNYTNLSIARSLRRSKEVGIRKIVGANRSQVFFQFIMEAVIISLIALVASLGLSLLIKPEFMRMLAEGGPVLMDFRMVHIIYFLAFSVAIGIIAGFLPSLILSKMKAIAALQDVSKLKLLKGVNLRRVLIVFQFTLSIAFIIGATISYRQYKFALNYDLGFSTENVLNVNLSGNDSDILLAEISKLPEVSDYSRSAMVMSTGDSWSDQFKYKDPLDSTSANVNYVDSNYLKVHDFEFVAGGSFPYDLKGDQEARFVIVDEQFIDRFDFESPEQAIGEIITLSDRRGDKKLEIAGVMKEFQYAKIEARRKPIVFFQGSDDSYDYLNLVVKTDNILGFMEKLEGVWRTVDKVHPFRAEFYDDRIKEAYAGYVIMFRIFGFLAFLAISIASMGLLGMAVFTTETRIKEISIRKVMGATEKHLVYILSRGFVFMLVVAAFIAMPLAYLFFTSVVMADSVNRISIGAFEMLFGVALIFAIGILTIGWQTWKAAKTNPAEMLRNE